LFVRQETAFNASGLRAADSRAGCTPSRRTEGMVITLSPKCAASLRTGAWAQVRLQPAHHHRFALRNFDGKAAREAMRVLKEREVVVARRLRTPQTSTPRPCP
jgi:hypothetical protein